MRTFGPQQPESPDRAQTRNGFRALVRRRPCAAARPLPALLAAAGFFAGLFVFGLALAAQTPAPPASAPAHPAAHTHKKPAAHKPAAQSAPAPASAALSTPVPVPCPVAGSAPVLLSATPCIPNWPANKRPSEASVVWDSHGLFIQASNSSLDQILRDISLKTGAKVEGMGADERVFGSYGPGPVRDVLGELLEGSGYNILLVGDLGQGTPRRIVLSGRPTGPAPPPVQRAEADEDQMTAPEPMQTGPQPQIPGSIPPPPVPARSPQVMMQQQQLMEQRQEQQMQQMRLQQQNNPENPQ